MMISGRSRMVYVGSATASDRITGVEEPFYGFLVKGAEGTNAMTSKTK
jgi:hypothetical protein